MDKTATETEFEPWCLLFRTMLLNVSVFSPFAYFFFASVRYFLTLQVGGYLIKILVISFANLQTKRVQGFCFMIRLAKLEFVE